MRWTCFWSCTYLSCPTSILVSCRGIGSSRSIPNPREQRREQSPAPKAGLVFLTGSAHPQQVPNPQLHPQTCPRMRPEHGSGWVHPLACPQGAHRVTPSVVGSAGSPPAQEHPHGSPRRDTDTKKTLHHQPGGCERWSNRDTSKPWSNSFPSVFCAQTPSKVCAGPSAFPFSLFPDPEQESLPLVAVWLTRMAWGKATLELGGRSCSWTEQTQNCTTKVS